MSVFVLLEFNAKPTDVNDITNWFRDELQHTRGFAGCNGITVHKNQDDPTHQENGKSDHGKSPLLVLWFISPIMDTAFERSKCSATRRLPSTNQSGHGFS